MTEIPYETLDLRRTAEEARRAERLRGIYHAAQDLAWDGREVLPALIATHGGVHAEPRAVRAIGRIFSVILWGELAAWRISAQLAADLVPLEAKMAATSQAFDEARHFYVMYDYLSALGVKPEPMPRASRELLELVLRQRDLTLKLVGMQLMVETTALTIFQAVRETGAEPVLCALLPYYEKDEARHVGLGVQHLPSCLKGMGRTGLARMTGYELRLIYWELASLAALEDDLRVLGIRAGEIVRLGTAKQLQAHEAMWAQIGEYDRGFEKLMTRAVHTVCEVRFPEDGSPRGALERITSARKVWRDGGYDSRAVS
ncbi:MAG: ferritin-like domain-containing protein [Deltaproteobacteria bacterium]|nr:ferritin-like domain-containing protein [Deltaproteobacteria bacterium]